jgi:hypothetical protein
MCKYTLSDMQFELGKLKVPTDYCQQTFPNNPERMVPLIDEFQTQWDIRVANFAQRYVTARLNSIINTYTPLAQNGNPQQALALEVLNVANLYLQRIVNELHF